MGVIFFYNKFSCRIGSVLEGGFADAILLVEGVEIPVHRCILAANSEYFKRIFGLNEHYRKATLQKGPVCGSQAITEIDDTFLFNHQSIVEISDVPIPIADNVIELKNTKVEVVRAVLDYFYKGQYDYHENVEIHLLALELAHQLRLNDLEESLIDQLVQSIILENFVQFFNLKMRYENVKLDNSCVSFLKENGEEIAKSDSFSKLTRVSLMCLLDEDSFAAAEIDIFRAAERWVSVNKPNEKTKRDMVRKFRLATMSMEDLFDVVSTSKELPSIDIMEPIRSITKKDAASTNFRHLCRVPDPVPDLNVAQSSLGATILCGSITSAALFSGLTRSASRRVGGKQDCIVVKLDQIYKINALEFLLDSSGGRSYKYQIEVSVKEREWFRVVDHSNYWCRSHQFLRFDPRAVRYIRMTGTAEVLQINSFKAMYTNKECSLEQGIQIASSNVVLTSRGATVTGGFRSPMDCIDGKENSSTPVTEESPIIIKLGQPHWLASLRMKINANGNNYIVESSSDGESWQPVGTGTNVEMGPVWRIFEFSHRVVLQFRVTVKKTSSHYLKNPGMNRRPTARNAAPRTYLTSNDDFGLNLKKFLNKRAMMHPTNHQMWDIDLGKVSDIGRNQLPNSEEGIALYHFESPANTIAVTNLQPTVRERTVGRKTSFWSNGQTFGRNINLV